KLAPVTGDRNVLAVAEAEHSPARTRFQAEDAVAEVAEVDDAPDDRRRAGDRRPAPEAPQHPAVRRRGAVEQAVVRAEEDAAAPDRGRRVDVRAGVHRP